MMEVYKGQKVSDSTKYDATLALVEILIHMVFSHTL